jgi:hypothetical protein
VIMIMMMKIMLTEFALDRITRVLAPHSFEIDSTDGTVGVENSIERLVVCPHDSQGVSTAAQGVFSVIEGTYFLEVLFGLETGQHFRRERLRRWRRNVRGAGAGSCVGHSLWSNARLLENAGLVFVAPLCVCLT